MPPPMASNRRLIRSIGILAAMGSAQKLKRVTPEIILRARLIQDEKKLTNYGLSGERLLALKAKVEIAQAQFKNIRQEYMEFKNRVNERSRERMLHLKAEVKIAKLEFKASYAQWKAYVKMGQGLQA